MSKVAIEGNASGSGTLTIAAPNTNSNYTLTLPENTGTIITGTLPAGDLVGTTATQTLTNKSIVATQLTGTIAAARLPAGSVLQVVQGTFTTEDDISSASYVASSITASITPSSASNKVLILVSTTMQNTGNAVSCFTTLYRNATTNLGAGTETSMIQNYSVDGFDVQPTQIMYLDSPSSTSSVAYAVYAKASSGNVRVGKAAMRSTIILMEIAG